ncbi:MAG: amino acid permease [Proteobacteria bacterium]|nr:amino acid permease [Pseudomonadota bacterium]
MHHSEKEMVRGIGFLALLASCFNCTVGGGIFRLPASVFAISGNASPIVYVLCFLVMALVAGVFIIVGRKTQVSGGPYAYVKPVLGAYPGYVCGVLLWFLATLAFASVSNAYAHFAALLVSETPSAVLEAGILAVSLGGLAFFNSRGVKSGARVVLLMGLVKVLPLLFLLAIGLPHLDASRVALPDSISPDTIARGALVLIFAFTGVESALIPSGEIENPEKNLPRAILLSMGLVLMLYLGVHLVSESVLGPELAIPGIPPLAMAARKLVGEGGALVLAVGAVFSTLGYLSAMTLSLPRSLLAFSEDGYLPASLARISPVSHAPVRAIWIQVGVVYLLAVSSQFERLAVVSNVAAILMYTMCAVAAVVLLVRSAGGKKGLVLIPVLAILGMGWLLTSVTPVEWISVLALLALASVVYGMRHRRSAS